MTMPIRPLPRAVRRLAVLTYLGLAALGSACLSTPPKDYLDQGNQYARDGLLREAVESYRRAISLQPQNPNAYRNLGMVLVKVGNYKDAIRHLDQAMSHYKEDFDANFYLAEAYRAQEKFADAIFFYQKALQIKANDEKSLKALAWSYFRIRYYSEALETANRLYRLAPQDTQTAIIIARTLLKLQRYREALKTLSKAKDHSDSHLYPYLYSVEGDVLFELGQLPKAASLYNLALQSQPLLAGALLGLGKCHLEEKRMGEAIKYMERALRIRPSLTETHLLLGRAYEKQDSQKAIKHYQQFREQASSDPEFLRLLSEVSKRIAALKKAGGPNSSPSL